MQGERNLVSTIVYVQFIERSTNHAQLDRDGTKRGLISSNNTGVAQTSLQYTHRVDWLRLRESLTLELPLSACLHCFSTVCTSPVDVECAECHCGHQNSIHNFGCLGADSADSEAIGATLCPAQSTTLICNRAASGCWASPVSRESLRVIGRGSLAHLDFVCLPRCGTAFCGLDAGSEPSDRGCR